MVFVYHGGVDGVNPTAAVLLESDQAGAQFGISVAGAGDVNGDGYGYSDVLVGADRYDNGQVNEGAAFVYLGNRDGRPVQARQFRTDGSTPVQHWSLSHDSGAFALTMRVTSPRGRERVKLQAQVCPNGSDFGTVNCITVESPAWTDVTATGAGITLPLAVTGLPPGGLYHWRARSLHAPYTVTAVNIIAPPNPMHGPWRRLMAREDVADVRTILPAPPADLSIVMTDGVTSAVPGQTVTYTIVASNAGPNSVTGARVTDTFPASLSCAWTCVGANGGGCTATGSGNISDTVNLPMGGSVTYTASCLISSAATGTLRNTASVWRSTSDPSHGNNVATDTDTLTPQADLSLTKTDGSTSAAAGGIVTYTIKAANAGPSDAPNATVVDTFPGTLTCAWTCADTGNATCTANGSGNIHDIVKLPNGESVTYTASCTLNALAAGTLSNTATVTAPAAVPDPALGNNSQTDSDTIVPSPTANLAVTKTDGVTTAVPGQSVTYTIVASNAGPNGATGARVTDTFPTSLTCAWTCVGTTGGTCTATGTGNISDTVNLPMSGSVTYTASCTISASATGTLMNTASVTTPNGVIDPTPDNNAATDTDTLASCLSLATLTPPNQIVIAGVSTANVTVTAPSGCGWTAGSHVPWVTITPPASGSGSGTLAYSVVANPGPNPRRGTMTIAGKTFIVSQRTPVPAPCTISASTPGSPIAVGGGTGSVTITTSTVSCQWQARSHVPWITLTSATIGSGSGAVGYSVAANTSGGPRKGRITVNGKRATIIQN